MKQMNRFRMRIVENHMLDCLDANESSERKKEVIRAFAEGKNYTAVARQYEMKPSQIENIVRTYVGNTRHFRIFMEWCDDHDIAASLAEKYISPKTKRILLLVAESKSVCQTCAVTGANPASVYAVIRNFVKQYIDSPYRIADTACPYLMRCYRIKRKIELEDAAKALKITPEKLEQHEACKREIPFATLLSMMILYDVMHTDLMQAFAYFKDRGYEEVTLEDVENYFEHVD